MLRAVAAIIGGLLVVLLLATGLTVRLAPRPKSGWKAFSIAPAAGMSTSVRPGFLRADGITLQFALSVAYGIPTSRIIAPEWVAQARYSMVAETSPEDVELFRELFLDEIKSRFHVDARIEKRPFDAFVLSGGRTQDLTPDDGGDPSSAIHFWDAQLRNATMDRLASAVQAILAKPVLNETGIAGSYRIDLAWSENRAAALAAALRNKFGLELTAVKRDLEALVVDRIEPDSALSVIRQIGSLTANAPRGIRRAISEMVTIH